MAGEIITVGTLLTSVRVSRGEAIQPGDGRDRFDQPDRQEDPVDVVSLSPQALALAGNRRAAASPGQPEPTARGERQAAIFPGLLLDIRV